MSVRQQLPVASPVSKKSLVQAAFSAAARSDHDRLAVEATLRQRFDARRAVLTDSGTSALVAALRLVGARGGPVAFPGYACVDLAAAALYAGTDVCLYDIDPETLSPDLDSLERALRRGVSAIVVAYLYGYPGDMGGVTSLARQYGVPIIEDAAQGAGGTLHTTRLGSFGDLTVLSFGRGKGTCGGSGGALLARGQEYDAPLAELAGALDSAPAGWVNLLKLVAQVALGRPSVYGVPARIPALRLGEMVYHPAHDPGPISRTAATVVRSALRLDPAAVTARRSIASRLCDLSRESSVLPVRVIHGGESGYLRFVVRDTKNVRSNCPAIGVLRGYPTPVCEQGVLGALLIDRSPHLPGSQELSRSLFTLPTHHWVGERDIAALRSWLVGELA